MSDRNRTPAAGQLARGDRLGPYEIRAPLGAGGMGEVYRARDTRLHRDVALKVIRASLLRPPYVQRFEREARAAAALNHPNIVAVFDVNLDEAVPYVVTELLVGESLRARLRRGPIPFRKALDYAVQTAEALAAAHAGGIYHRDVKPGNVFVTSAGQVKLLDFGLAKPQTVDLLVDTDASTESDPSLPGHVVGTVGHMAPEQLLGEPIDHRADIFGLGTVLYEMFGGRRAFLGATPSETVKAVLSVEPEDLLALEPSLPRAAAAAVHRCLEKKPEERFQSARDLAFHLRQLTVPDNHATLPPRPRPRGLAVASALVAATTVAVLWWLTSSRSRAPSFEQLTFHRGHVEGARFAGQSIVYSSAFGLGGPQVWLRLADSPESRPLGHRAAVLATRGGELALLTHRRFAGGERFVGTLAIAPLGGGAPYEKLEDVEDADWDDASSEFAVARSEGLGTGSRLEYPIGRVLYRSPGSIHSPRLSSGGGHVAFLEDPSGLGDAGHVVILDREGAVVLTGRSWPRARGLAWSPEGDEVWYTAGEGAANRALRATRLDGKERVVHEAPGSLTILDADADGRVLLTREDERMAVVGMAPGAGVERDLSWFDDAGVASLSRDGRTLLLGDRFGIYLRPTDGSPAAKVGNADGFADDLSPDGSLVLTTSPSADRLVLFPTGPGLPRPLRVEGIETFSGSWWFPDGRRILFAGREPGRELRSYVVDASGGKPVAVTDEGVWALSISPEGTVLAATAADRGISIWPVAGGRSREVPGSRPGDRPVAWSSDGSSLWVFRRGEIPAPVYQVDVASGRRKLWKTLSPPDAAGIYSIDELRITPSGNAYFYSYRQALSELYLVRGLR